MLRAIASLFLMGISFGASQCLVSCGPLFLSYVSGSNKNVAKSLSAYLIFSSARIAAYVLIGVLVYSLGKFITEGVFEGAARYIYILGGIFIICIGLLMALGKKIEFFACKFLYKNLLEKDKKSIFIFGLIVGLLPCAPLFALFSWVALIAKSWFLSAVYAFSFGLGTFLSPLALLAVFAAVLPKALLKFKPQLARILNFTCAGILILLGIQLIGRAF